MTVNYGLRWDIIFPETVNGKGQGGLLDYSTGDIRIAGYGPWGTNLNVGKNWTNFAPTRWLGLASASQYRVSRGVWTSVWTGMVGQ